MEIWNFPNRFTTGWEKLMAKIVIRLPEPNSRLGIHTKENNKNILYIE